MKSFAFHRILTFANSRCVSFHCLYLILWLCFSFSIFLLLTLFEYHSFTFAYTLNLSHFCQQKVLTIASIPWHSNSYTRDKTTTQKLFRFHVVTFFVSLVHAFLMRLWLCASVATEMQVFFISRFQSVCLQPKPFLSGFLFIYFFLCRCSCCCCLSFFSLFIKT